MKKDENGVSPVIAVILMVAITVVLAGVLYVWVTGIADVDGGQPIILPLDVGDANADVQDVMFYIRHDGGEPTNLRDYIIKAGPVGAECDVSLTEDVRSGSGYNSTWDNQSKVISVNERVHFMPSCLGDIEDGDEISVLIVDRDTNHIVWKGNTRVYDE